MSDIELPDLPPLKTVAWQITNDDISYWTAVRDRSAASAIKDEHELAGFPDSTMAALVLRSDAEAAILADREKRAQPAQPHAYAVYFPDRPCEELVHDLDELLDDMTNREHTVTPLFATEASKPVQAEAPRRPLTQEELSNLPRNLSVEQVMALATTVTPHDDPATKQVEAPTASNEREELLRGEVDAITELNHAQWLALENVRTLAARNRKEDWAQHLLRWCEEAGNASRTLRAALATQQEAQPQADPDAAAKVMYAKHPTYRGTMALPWEAAPDLVRQEWREKAARAVPAGGDKEDADKYRLIRRGQHWSVIDGIGNTLRGDDLDAAVDAIRAARAAQQATERQT